MFSIECVLYRMCSTVLQHTHWHGLSGLVSLHEVCGRVKRDLFIWQKRPFEIGSPEVCMRKYEMSPVYLHKRPIDRAKEAYQSYQHLHTSGMYAEV